MLIRWTCRFPAPGKGGNRDTQFRENVMGWIEQQATEAWAPEENEAKAQAAVDFLTVYIKPIPIPTPSHPESGVPDPRMQWSQMSGLASASISSQNSGQTLGHGGRRGMHTSGPPTPSNEKVPRKRRKTEREIQKQRGDAEG